MARDADESGALAIGETCRFLAHLAAPRDPGNPRHLPGAGSETIEALLDAIDETVMSRSLRLTNRTGAVLTLDVCNRRLLRMEGGSVAVPDLSYAGGSDLTALLDHLLGFAAAGGVVLDRAASVGEARLGETGVTAAMLRQAWAGALRPALPGTLHDLCAPVLPLCRSWVCHDPDADSTADGDSDEIDRLVSVLERVSPEAIGDGDPAALLLDNGADALLLLRWGDGFAAFLLPAPEGIAALDALGLGRFGV